MILAGAHRRSRLIVVALRAILLSLVVGHLTNVGGESQAHGAHAHAHAHANGAHAHSAHSHAVGLLLVAGAEGGRLMVTGQRSALCVELLLHLHYVAIGLLHALGIPAQDHRVRRLGQMISEHLQRDALYVLETVQGVIVRELSIDQSVLEFGHLLVVQLYVRVQDSAAYLVYQRVAGLPFRIVVQQLILEF